MAWEVEAPCSVRGKKRKSRQSEPKLTVGANVEVRSVEDGLLGSWHLGTVIACSPLSRTVRYRSFIVEDSSDEFNETVPVSTAIEGVDSGYPNKCSNYRGRIRPLPPDVTQDPGELLYGLCVDVYHADAWWEGVIFDRHAGAKKRNVFFPDLGDQLLINVRNIRISQDWIEREDSWIRCGFWCFLKVIQAYEEQTPLPVSVKQIWYDLRQKSGYKKIKEWTCSNEVLWQKTVFITLVQNLKIALRCILPPFDSQEEMVREKSTASEFIEQPSDLGTVSETDISNCLSIEPAHETPCCQSERCQLVSSDFVAAPEFRPDAFASYLANQFGPSLSSARMVLKKHMTFLGWKTESFFSGNSTRMRYVSPDGKCYYSLLEVCRGQCRNAGLVPASSSDSARNILVASPGASLFSSPSHMGNSEDQACPISSAVSAIPNYKDYDHTPYCPQAVTDYYELGLEQCSKGVYKELRSKVKQELLDIGWTTSYQYKNRKREMVYVSPKGRKYTSLRQACRGCIQDEEIPQLMLGTLYPAVEVKFPSKEPPPSVSNRGEKDLLYPKTERVDNGRKLRRLKTEGTRHLKLKIKFSGALVKPAVERDISRPTPVRQSCKRVKKIVSGHSVNPKTVLSLLIDNDILLPRLKVYCRRDSNSNSLIEGRLQRDGIRCCCCHDLLTLNEFVSHAGGKCCSPASRIFLGDGRSLLDCQVQFLQKNRRVYLVDDPGESTTAISYAEESWENDQLCSICHFGGELILCDLCPSSFHTTCLGLKDVPDGEWFCPPCCCGICGEGKLREDVGYFRDAFALNCNQCKHKYHTVCLRERGMIEAESHLRGKWFCSKKCEQIHGDLQELDGKKIRLGMDNLTMTLLKSADYKIHDDVNLQMKSAAENYVKLKIALDVMHECFEPVEEPCTRRDIVEDVIFNRRSELNRLNFQGFYSVLLEKNDELITVATIRIHGTKLAELPLVSTRFPFRRLGMCRTLMDALEKKLKEIGVERIVLPAIPSALNTWTVSFGFTEMTELERLQLVNHTFVNFQGTIMCHKYLVDTSSAKLDIPSTEARALSGNLPLKLSDDPKGSPNCQSEGSCTVSKESQGKALEERETTEQATAMDVDGSDISVEKIDQMKGPSPWGSSEEEDNCRFLKYYQRKRLRVGNIGILVKEEG